MTDISMPFCPKSESDWQGKTDSVAASEANVAKKKKLKGWKKAAAIAGGAALGAVNPFKVFKAAKKALKKPKATKT